MTTKQRPGKNHHFSNLMRAAQHLQEVESELDYVKMRNKKATELFHRVQTWIEHFQEAKQINNSLLDDVAQLAWDIDEHLYS